jgi:hypothetical protein
MTELEADNIAEIEGLNQRGGRTLSFVDLIEAGTMSAEMAGEFAAMVESGSSILTAARLGGVGKSTLLAGLLACLPPGERIVTTPGLPEVEAAAARDGEAECYLAHEIGRGPYYAYLWGPAAAGFFGLAAAGRRIATCLHADEIEETYRQLDSQGIDMPTIRSISMVAFIKKFGNRRRVDSVYVTGPKAHRVRWLWEEDEDVFVPQGASPVDDARALELADVFDDLATKRVHEFAEVRSRLAGVLRSRG